VPRVGRWRGAVAAAFAAAAILAAPNPAGAVPGNTPDPGWPQVDGPVKAIALAGNRLYIGGSFTTVGGQAHQNVAALNATTGAVDPGFTAGANGQVQALAVSGSQLYLGGQFMTVDGMGRPRLAAVDPTTGALTLAFDPKVGTGDVRALALSSTRLYAAGDAIQLAGSPPAPNPRQLWAFDPATGNVDTGFNGPQPNARMRALLLSGTRLYLGGEFTMLDTTARRGVAAVDPATGALDAGFDAKADSDVDALAAAGSHLYLGGSFAHVGGLQRVGLAAVNNATGAADHGWVADADHPLDALATSDSRLYAGGVKGSFGSLGSRTVVAARVSDGQLSTDFGPDFGAGLPQVYALAISNSRLYAGGSFTMAGGEEGVAAFRLLPPVNVSAPFIQGNPVKGKRISCRPGVWRNDPTGFAFRWLRNGVAIKGATAATHKIGKADVRHGIACRVTASNPVGPGTARSAAVTPALPDTTPPKVKIVSRELRMNGNGVVRVRLSCPKSEKRCSGTVVLRVLGLKGRPLLGVSGFSVRGGRRRAVKVALDAASQDLVRRHSPLQVRVRVNARDAAGNAARLSRTRTLVAA